MGIPNWILYFWLDFIVVFAGPGLGSLSLGLSLGWMATSRPELEDLGTFGSLASSQWDVVNANVNVGAFFATLLSTFFIAKCGTKVRQNIFI